MPGRQVHPDARDGSTGMVYLNWSILTNGASNPINTYSLNGAQARGDMVQATGSIVHTATGKYTLTLDKGYTCRYVSFKTADIEANAAGDGAYATITAPSQGEGDGNPPVFTVFTHAATGTLTDFTGRRMNISLALKCSQAGF